MTEILIRYFHFIGIMLLSTTLLAEYILLSKEISLVKLKKVLKIDAVFGLSALIVLGTGLLQWFVVGKPSAYFNTNFMFHIKFTIFLIMAILSLFPTRFYFKKRKQGKDVVRIPKSIFTFLKIELLLLIIIPLLAVLMANGFGNF